MLLDLIDFLEPTMVIVGSRGLGKLKGWVSPIATYLWTVSDLGLTSESFSDPHPTISYKSPLCPSWSHEDVCIDPCARRIRPIFVTRLA